MGYLRTSLVLLVVSLVLVGTSASETEEWRLEPGHHHHDMMKALCGENGEKCDRERLDRMHSFWQHGKPCDKGFKYPRHWGPRDTAVDGEATVSSSLVHSSDGLDERKVVIMIRPVLGRRGGPFGMEDEDHMPDMVRHAMEHLLERSRELRKQYIDTIAEEGDMRWGSVEERMKAKMEALFNMETSQEEEEEEQEPWWKRWVHHCMNKMQSKPALLEPSDDDSIMSSLKGIDWRLFDDEGNLNMGLVLFVALACTSAAIWTSLTIQLVQYVLFYYHSSPSEYDHLDTPCHKTKECSDPSETKGLLKGQEPCVK